MILITGTAGFIGSCLLQTLHQKQFSPIVISDSFNNSLKNKNIKPGSFSQKIDRNDLFNFLGNEKPDIEFVFHIGARTDTTEFDKNIFDELNLNYSKKIWNYCSENNIPLIYASSAATYGMGEFGFNDDESIINKLKPLNPYGTSKNEFDKWVIAQNQSPPNWYGLKFFNVYGPNEYHKGRMASVIFHAYHQIKETKAMKLFESHHPDFNDGEQQRDFIYVKDVVDVCLYLYQNRPKSGIYNLGTGQARTFLDLTRAVFSALEIKERITFIPTPEDIRDKYQYFTEANMHKLRKTKYSNTFTSLEAGVNDYVRNYLLKNKHF